MSLNVTASIIIIVIESKEIEIYYSNKPPQGTEDRDVIEIATSSGSFNVLKCTDIEEIKKLDLKKVVLNFSDDDWFTAYSDLFEATIYAINQTPLMPKRQAMQLFIDITKFLELNIKAVDEQLDKCAQRMIDGF